MLRLFVALNLLLLNLYACKGGYDSCKNKINDSNSISNNILQIPVKKHQRIIFSRTTPDAKVLKHDPFLSLYLVEDKKGFKHPFKINHRLTLGTAVVNQKEAVEGKILKRQVGLNSFAMFSECITVPSLLLTSCCSLEGIATPEGVIEKAYIDRFINIKKVSYSDIGIRVKDEKKSVVVKVINPFMQGNPFKVNDFILEVNGKRVKNASGVMRDILFSKIGSTHNVKVKRNSKVLTLKTKSQKRYGGGYLSDIFLEFVGISFDKNLKVVKIEEKAKKYSLKLGDKLLKINQKEITTEADILETISKSEESTNLLFVRDDFQFFVKIN
ncbi:MAG: PDZ domain-containing protein [Campylobacterota bacterium]